MFCSTPMSRELNSLYFYHIKTEKSLKSPVFSNDEVTCTEGDESWHCCLFSQSCHPLLLSLQGGSHHPSRRLVLSSLQQPFLIWLALAWHIPEPKCTHKLLSLVARLFIPEWFFIKGGWAFSIGLRWQGKRPVVYYFNTFGSRNACLDPFALRAYFSILAF